MRLLCDWLTQDIDTAAGLCVPACGHAGDVLSGVGCQHLHHKVCLHEWLRIRACCPLCKMPLPSTVVPGSRGGDGDGEGGVLSQDN